MNELQPNSEPSTAPSTDEMSTDLDIPFGDATPVTSRAELMAREIEAMQRLETVFHDLPDQSINRVIRWFVDSLGISPAEQNPTTLERTSNLGLTVTSFTDIAELFDVAEPTSGPERALVAAYWFQVIEAADDFDSQTINSALKNLGYPSSNITSDFSKLMRRTPRLVQQVRKEGRSQQARKRYKLTREGIRLVEAKIRHE